MSELIQQWTIDQIYNIWLERSDKLAKLADMISEQNNSKLSRDISILQSSIKELESEEEKIRDYMKQVMIDSNMKKFQALDGNMVQLDKKPWKLLINDSAIIPSEYKKEKVTILVDKKSLKEDIKQGLIIEGVSILEDYNLIIKI